MAIERVYRVKCDACGFASTPEISKEQARITARHEGINWRYCPTSKGPPKKRDQCDACRAAVKERNDAILANR